MSGEFDFISFLRAQVKTDARVVIDIGDDLAAVKSPREDLLLVGVDQVLDGVHFDSAVHSPREIGRKVMNRNLSDCAAMACWPWTAVATVALPRGVGMEYARELYMGLRNSADPFDCRIIGGDTGSWAGKLVVTVTILGVSGGISPVPRFGAQPGDHLYVSGKLGGSILGRHMTFLPRVELARKLASMHTLHAMIDLSDGLSRDLGHICRQSGVGAIVEASGVPIHDDAVTLSKSSGKSPLEHALHDGEDYELLLCSPDAIPGLFCIGTITDDEQILLRTDTSDEELRPAGWEHSL